MTPSRWKTAPSSITCASQRPVTLQMTYLPRTSEEAMFYPATKTLFGRNISESSGAARHRHAKGPIDGREVPYYSLAHAAAVGVILLSVSREAKGGSTMW